MVLSKSRIVSSKSRIASTLAAYGLGHLLIDATCAALVFSLQSVQALDDAAFLQMAIIYNVLAFGLQIVAGLLADRLRAPKAAAMIGIALAAASVGIFSIAPIVAIISVAIANALFHVGGGSISLNLTPGKAAAPGIFVAPGAIGVLVGTLIGKTGGFAAWEFVIALIVVFVVMYAVRAPEINYERRRIATSRVHLIGAALLLILTSIAVRSFVGAIIVFPWKSDMALLLVLTAAIVLGKGLGGVIADRFGWMRIGIGSLVASIPLLAFGATVPAVAILGMFLFNVTMPITLVAISNVLPGRPAFAFGLASTALIFGALPVFSAFRQPLGAVWMIFATILISSTVLYFGLRAHGAIITSNHHEK